MRISMTLVLFAVAACAKAEQAATDTAAMTAGPAAVTEADVAGTWTGEAKMEGSDSVVAHWTNVCSGGNCTATAQENTDTVRATYSIDADSVHGVSAAYVASDMGGARVVEHWIARPSGGSVTGRGWYVLADKPDSVLARTTFSGTRK